MELVPKVRYTAAIFVHRTSFNFLIVTTYAIEWVGEIIHETIPRRKLFKKMGSVMALE